MAGPGEQVRVHAGMVRLWPWLLALAALWVLLTGGADPLSWVIGLPAILVGAWVAMLLEPPNAVTLNVRIVMRFVPWFLKTSLTAGVDVASRAMTAEPRINPDFIVYRSRLPDGAPLVFFSSCICLLPGTLTADLDGHELTIHVIDKELENVRELQRLENWISQVFGGEPLPGDAS